MDASEIREQQRAAQELGDLLDAFERRYPFFEFAFGQVEEGRYERSLTVTATHRDIEAVIALRWKRREPGRSGLGEHPRGRWKFDLCTREGLSVGGVDVPWPASFPGDRLKTISRTLAPWEGPLASGAKRARGPLDWLLATLADRLRQRMEEDADLVARWEGATKRRRRTASPAATAAAAASGRPADSGGLLEL